MSGEQIRPEHEFLVLCSRISLTPDQIDRAASLMKGPLDWSEIISLSTRHMVTPLVYENLCSIDLSDKLPPAVNEEMRNLTAKNLAQNMQKNTELCRVLDAFESKSIKTIVMKGPIISQTIYSNESMRVYGDLDLLISKKNLASAKETMLALGYSLVRDNYNFPDELNEDLGCEWNYYSQKAVIEVHWNLVDTSTPFKINPDDLIDRAIELQFDGRTVLSLSFEDQLLNLCIHQFKHHWHYLRDLCDISEFVIKYKTILDWDVLLKRSAATGADSCLFYSFLLVQHVFETPVPNHVMMRLEKHVSPGLIDKSIFELIEKNILAYETPHGYWPVILINGLKSKLANVLDTTLQQSATDNNEHHQPPASNKQRGFYKVASLVAGSLFSYRKLLLQLGSLTLKNFVSQILKIFKK